MSEQDVYVYLADEVFKIPKNYLFPIEVDSPESIKKTDIVEITLFFPDLSGYDKGKKVSGIGPYDIDQVSVYWTEIGGGEELDATFRLKNGIKYGVLQRDASLDIEGMTAYEKVVGDGVAYTSSNARGDNVLIDCSDGAVNAVCTLRFVDSLSGRGIFASFDKLHLSKWSDIGSEVLDLIAQWELDPEKAKQEQSGGHPF